MTPVGAIQVNAPVRDRKTRSAVAKLRENSGSCNKLEIERGFRRKSRGAPTKFSRLTRPYDDDSLSAPLASRLPASHGRPLKEDNRAQIH
jgi:hypothetical protein